jgi:chromate transporter
VNAAGTIASVKPNLLSWVLINLKIGALSFGGAGRALLFHEEVVERRQWLSDEEFQEVFTLAQGLPGPNLINICAYLGYQFVGFPGVILGLLGLAIPGAFAAVAAYSVLDFHNHQLVSFFRGMALGSVALIAMLCVKTGSGLRTKDTTLRSDDRAVARFVIAFAIAAASLAGVPIVWVFVGGIACGVGLELGS